MKSHRDNLLSTLRREGFKKVPMDISLCPSQQDRFKVETGSDDVEDFFNLSYRYVGVKLKSMFENGYDLFIRE